MLDAAHPGAPSSPGGATARDDLQRELAARLVDHLAVELDRAAALGALRARRGSRCARSISSGAGRERVVDDRDLSRVHRPLAVEAERAGVLGAQPQARVVPDLEVRPVDRLEPARRGPPPAASPARSSQRSGGRTPGGTAQRRREVGVAEDQRLQPRRARADLADVQQAGRGLDERLQAHSGGALAQRVEQALDRGDVCSARSTLGSDQRVDRGARAPRELDDVALAPRAGERVDAHGDRRRAGASRVRGSRATSSRASSLAAAATESSRSTTISSAPSRPAFASIRSDEPGTDSEQRLERTRRPYPFDPVVQPAIRGSITRSPVGPSRRGAVVLAWRPRRLPPSTFPQPARVRVPRSRRAVRGTRVGDSDPSGPGW